MEAIGQLTGGVAHDFNNLLLVISGATHRLAATALDPAAQRALDMIATAVKRGQNLTSQLLTIARRQTTEPTVIELGALLPTFSEMLRRAMRGNIEIRTVAADGPCRVRIDMTELELALLNLGVNARDAMPDGGVLTLSIKTVSLAGEAEAEGLRGDYALLETSDTGTGISPKLIARVFEPFFTTKGPGEGTGLGLSQVYGFARQSGGTATARSIPGQGTTIALYLPVTDLLVEPSHAAPRTQDQEAPGRALGSVLLIEDNDDVATISAGYLEELGYQVDCVSNGADALRRLETTPSYSLIFSDILMPGGTSGLELARIVRERHPDLPVLLTTGYSASAQEAAQAGFSVILKPFDLSDLTAAVRDVTVRRRGEAGC
jgi:two-component system NtrC family sensor kinase